MRKQTSKADKFRHVSLVFADRNLNPYKTTKVLGLAPDNFGQAAQYALSIFTALHCSPNTGSRLIVMT